MNDNLKPITTIPPFKRLCMTIGELPSSYLESMTYYEMLLWFTKYLQETVIPTINNNGEAVTELQTKYLELKNYVDTYFDNLDVQEEINNKLDEMAESGDLQAIIENILKTNVMVYFPDTNTYGDLSCLKLYDNTSVKNCIIDFADNVDNSTYLAIKTKLINKGFNKFDYAIISHYHKDHVGNLNYMLNDSDFDFSECTFYLPPTPDYSQFIGSTTSIQNYENDIITLLETKNIPYIKVTNNTVINAFNDITITFYNADNTQFSRYYNITYYNSTAQETQTNYNNFSIVAQVNHKNERLLFTGDIEKEAEKVIIEQGLQKPNLLKIEHHGITGVESYDEEYVKNYWFPDIAVGLGDVESPLLYIRRKAKDIETYYTFYSGDVTVNSSGYNLLATSENGRFNPDYTIERYNIIKGLTGYLNLADTNVPHYINSNEDLDDYITAGTYCCSTRGIAETLTNKPPFDDGFKLIVLVNTIPEHIIQIAFQNFTAKMWVRYGNKNDGDLVHNFSNWSTFSMLGSNRILAEGTDLNDLLIGNYSVIDGTTANTILNKPDGMPTVAFSVEVSYLTDRNDRFLQVLKMNSDDNIVYVRTKTGNDWSSWCPVDTMKNRLIANGSNLNNLPVGNWCSNAAAQTTTLSNVPSGVSGGFNLEVRYTTWNNNARKFQRLIPNTATPVIYYRVLAGDNWGSWYKFEGTVVS